MVYCRNCGQFSEEGNDFCRNCGTTLGQVSPKQQTPPKPYGWADDSPYAAPKKQPAQFQPKPEARQAAVGYPPIPQNPQFNQHIQPQNFVGNVPAHGYRCPRCGTNAFPQTQRKIAVAGWITFAVLLFVFFPLFWVGLLIKEDSRVCPMCMFEV